MPDLCNDEELSAALGRADRLAVLDRTGQLDSPPEEAFDVVTRLATRVLRAPISLVSLIDGRRQFLKSERGMPEPWSSQRQTPLSHSFCQHLLGSGRPLVIQDSRNTPPLAQHPATVELGIAAYAGVPLTVDGQRIGAFCVADHKPRRWSERDLAVLRDLASLVVVQIERDMARRALQQALDAQTLADRRKDEFLATLAHELRNPIAPIRNAVHVLRHVDATSPLANQSVGIIERQVRLMRRLVDDLLDVNRITRDALRLERRRVALDEVLDTAVESVRPQLDERGIVLEQQRPSQPVWLDADPVRLSQALINLLNNAAKFTARGGRVTLEATTRPDALSIHVHDTGIGIEADSRDRIFELFTQGTEGASLRHGGLGIGLSLARRLVEMHGGTLTVDSPGRGQGSTFSVRLPARQRDAR